jgi:hypothetical protein
MSNIAIKGATTGTGVFTLESPATNTDRTLVLPDEAGTVLTSASDVEASQITTALNATGSAPIYACRAWVNFNGTGTVAIRAAGNVSSITDNAPGNYTVNFTTAMVDANYCAQGTSKYNASATGQNVRLGASTYESDFTTTALNVQTTSAGNSSLTDSQMVSVAIFR